jgi:hypothetical protein
MDVSGFIRDSCRNVRIPEEYFLKKFPCAHPAGRHPPSQALWNKTLEESRFLKKRVFLRTSFLEKSEFLAENKSHLINSVVHPLLLFYDIFLKLRGSIGHSPNEWGLKGVFPPARGD